MKKKNSVTAHRETAGLLRWLSGIFVAGRPLPSSAVMNGGVTCVKGLSGAVCTIWVVPRLMPSHLVVKLHLFCVSYAQKSSKIRDFPTGGIYYEMDRS